MVILGIETSCDETAAAVLKKEDPSTHKTRSELSRITILSNVVTSSANLQSKYGGIIPEQAAREQTKAIIPVIDQAIHNSQFTIHDLDAIAVTQGPGLIGSLLVGVETAKVLSLIWNKPLIPVNHLIGHFYANWIEVTRGGGKRGAPMSARNEVEQQTPNFPCLGLLVSGGHTDLVLFEQHGKYEQSSIAPQYKYLGGTRDDAAGECFDKCARLLGYPYPGGPKISKIAEKGNPGVFKLPSPMHNSKDFDFSFSGLKTAFANLIKNQFSITQFSSDDAKYNWQRIALDNKPLKKQEQILADLCASLQQAIINSLVEKTIKAAQMNKVEQIMVAGGVATNQKLKSELLKAIAHNLPPTTSLFIPPPYLCTDNAAMIASAAFFQKPTKNPLSLQADPNLSLR